ncbi:MAG: hypothetical protein RL682_1314 [Pseudomonadota bacterium]|jgi:hypothetical protein
MNDIANNQTTSEPPTLAREMDDLEKAANLSFAGVGVLGFLVVFAYFVKFSGFGFSNNQADWGTLGDYIGGVLNPTISVVTLYWLTRSIILQRRELQESREALRDTAYSQSKQAASSEIAAKFQLLSIELEIISSELASELSYQMQICSIMNNDSSGREIYDRAGILRSFKDISLEVQKEVSRLSEKRKRVFNAVRVIAPGFNYEVDLAKQI